MEEHEQILYNQQVLAKALVWLVWNFYPDNPSKKTQEMRRELAKLAGEQ